MRIVWSVLGLAIAATACGGQIQGGGNGGDSGIGEGVDGGGGGGGGGGGIFACPATAPKDGTVCAIPNLECEYGADFDPTCNSRWLCISGIWRASKGPPCTGTGSTACPATFQAVPRMSTCPMEAISCTYPQGRCTCTHNIGPYSLDPLWVCSDPSPGCPGVRPRLGTGCAQPSQLCDYGACSIDGGSAVRCESGAWKRVTDIACPD